jgi:hypothetical protein
MKHEDKKKEVLSHLKKDIKEEKKAISEDVKLEKKVKEHGGKK